MWNRWPCPEDQTSTLVVESWEPWWWSIVDLAGDSMEPTSSYKYVHSWQIQRLALLLNGQSRNPDVTSVSLSSSYYEFWVVNRKLVRWILRLLTTRKSYSCFGTWYLKIWVVTMATPRWLPLFVSFYFATMCANYWTILTTMCASHDRGTFVFSTFGD